MLAGDRRRNLRGRYPGKVVLVVLGLPRNDCGGQEPSGERGIKDFCRLTCGAAFPVFATAHARLEIADTLYRTLGELAGEYPGWNFRKYLLDRDVANRWAAFPTACGPAAGRNEARS